MHKEIKGTLPKGSEPFKAIPRTVFLFQMIHVLFHKKNKNKYCIVYTVLKWDSLINAYFEHPWSLHLSNCAPLFGHPISMLSLYDALTL